MKWLISVVLFALFPVLASCVMQGAAGTCCSSNIDVDKAVAILHQVDLVMSEGPCKYGDLDGVAHEVSKRCDMTVPVFDIVESVRVLKLISTKYHDAHRVSKVIVEQYADGEYAWVKSVLEETG